MKVLKVIGKCFWGFIKIYLWILAFFTVMFGIPLMTMMAPKVCGIVGGVTAAVGLAFCVTVNLIYGSNHFGDVVGTYKDYTDAPMKFEA